MTFPLRVLPLLAASIFLPGAGLAAAPGEDRAALVDFFAGQGCAIGPSTREAAVAAGFAPEQIDALQDAEAGRAGAVSGGGWLVMAPDACTMRPPEIAGVLQLDDPDVVAAISAPDAYLDADSPGCFLDPNLFEHLQLSRGWDADRANDEYIRLIARSLISGEMTFFSPSNLLTPMGLQLTTGACADAAPMPEIRRSHDFLIRNFDPLMRGFLAQNACDESARGWMEGDVNTLPGLAEGTSTPNAWTPLEAHFIALGAGWNEGMTASFKGVARPPLCHYPDNAADTRSAKRKARRDAGGP